MKTLSMSASVFRISKETGMFAIPLKLSVQRRKKLQLWWKIPTGLLKNASWDIVGALKVTKKEVAPFIATDQWKQLKELQQLKNTGIVSTLCRRSRYSCFLLHVCSTIPSHTTMSK